MARLGRDAGGGAGLSSAWLSWSEDKFVVSCNGGGGTEELVGGGVEGGVARVEKSREQDGGQALD